MNPLRGAPVGAIQLGREVENGQRSDIGGRKTEAEDQRTEVRGQKSEEKMFWTRDGFDRANDICKESLLKLELPLIDNENKMLGTLWLVKDLNSDSISHYTLRRVEHLRRTVIGTLKKLEKMEKTEVRDQISEVRKGRRTKEKSFG